MAVKTPAFLESELGRTRPGDCLFHVIPAPLEKTVSYGGGASRGPKALLAASQELELWDGTGIPAEAGIFTAAPVDCSGTVEEAVGRIGSAVSMAARVGAVPVVLGGEHTVTVGALTALKDIHPNLGVVQFDAHADLRETYQGSPLSHACVMRRALDMGLPIFQIGVRSQSPDEAALRRKLNIPGLDAADAVGFVPGSELLPPGFPKEIYVTFDLDALDCSLMPATGTPEPGGLFWCEAVALLEAAMRGRRVVGLDFTELAPVPGLHAPDYTAAKLAYAAMGLALRSRP